MFMFLFAEMLNMKGGPMFQANSTARERSKNAQEVLYGKRINKDKRDKVETVNLSGTAMVYLQPITSQKSYLSESIREIVFVVADHRVPAIHHQPPPGPFSCPDGHLQ